MLTIIFDKGKINRTCNFYGILVNIDDDDDDDDIKVRRKYYDSDNSELKQIILINIFIIKFTNIPILTL